MSITIIWRTMNRYRDDTGQLCVVCSTRIIPNDIAIRDIQNTNLKKYYHPTCFIRANHEKANRIADFWHDLCNEFERGAFQRR